MSHSRDRLALEPIAFTAGQRIVDVERVDSDFDELRVTVRLRDPESVARIVFTDVRGYRVLDESQFLDELEQSGRDTLGLWRILDGGWISQEPRRFMLLPRSLGEYFVCGGDDCVDVVATSPPRIEFVPS